MKPGRSISPRHPVSLLVVAAVLFLAASQASGLVVTLGQRDFEENSPPRNLTEYQDAQVGEPPPFSGYIGSDLSAPQGSNFNASWTFSYAARIYPDARITIGLYDGDCFATSCLIVSSFTVDGFDFTAALNSQIQSTGRKRNGTYDIFSVDLSSILSALGDGSATVSLALQPGDGGQEFNGAGLDFSTLTVDSASPPGCSSDARDELLFAGTELVLVNYYAMLALYLENILGHTASNEVNIALGHLVNARAHLETAYFDAALGTFTSEYADAAFNWARLAEQSLDQVQQGSDSYTAFFILYSYYAGYYQSWAAYYCSLGM